MEHLQTHTDVKKYTQFPVHFTQLAVFCTVILLVFSCRPREERNSQIPPLPTEQKNTYQVHLQVLSEAIDDYPKNGDFYYKRAYLYFQNEQWAPSLQDMNKAIALDPNNGKYYLLRARLHQHLQRSDLAYADIEKAEKLQVQSSDFYTLLGELYTMRKQYDKATEALNKSLEKAPYNGQSFYWKGAIAMETGDTTTAMKLIRTSLEYNPGYVEAYNRMAEMLYNKRDTLQAKRYAQEGLQLASAHAGLHFTMGNIQKREGKLDSAKVHYLKALELNPSLYLASYRLGQIQLIERNYQDAINTFTKLRAYDKQIPEIYFLTGLGYERLGMKEEAMQQYEQGLQIDAGNAKLQKQYATLKWAIDHPIVVQKPAVIEPLEQLTAITTGTSEVKPIQEEKQ